MRGVDTLPKKSRKSLRKSIRRGCGLIRSKYRPGLFPFKPWALLLLMLLALPGLTSCGSSELSFPTEYQAVYLDNNQVFFGKITETSSPFPILRDVFFVQTQVDREKKETKHLLIRRGVEGHGPDFMRLNARHIVVIEPVAPDSRVAQLIREAKTPRPPEATKEAPRPPAAK